MKNYLSMVWELSTPKNITYMWGFGSFLGLLMVVQIMSGFFLAFYYTSGEGAWESVISVTREVSSGWIVRLIHSNMASFVFMIMFVHFFRGVMQSSFYLKTPWFSGWVIMFLTMMAAFLGYVLPWGQMSFWGATVIINLISILPYGKLLVIWLWGGFYVSSFTCSFFYAVHFLVPFIILVAVMAHLLFLHFYGSSISGGLSRSGSGISIKFGYLFSLKDMVNLIVFWMMLVTMLAYPDWSADPVNFVISDLSNSPLHIQPEWYFLHLYAILRSIPNKVGGLIGFGLALVLLLFLGFLNSSLSLSQFKLYNYTSWSFFSANLLLLWLGMQPVEAPYIFMGQVFTSLYFLFFFLCFFLDAILIIVY